MEYRVKLEVFEGPLDLLLHLINKAEVDIYDIPIAVITEQYMEYLWTMQELDLNLAGEFLVMATTLLSIKAKMLLPHRRQGGEREKVEEEIDPREVLVARLLEYKAFKEAAASLRKMEDRQSLFISRPVEAQSQGWQWVTEKTLGSVSLWELIAAMRQVMGRRKPEPSRARELPRQEITVNHQIEVLWERLGRQPSLSFKAFLRDFPDRSHMVVSFLAILELARLQKIMLVQKVPFGDILIMSLVSPSMQAMPDRDTA